MTCVELRDPSSWHFSAHLQFYNYNLTDMSDEARNILLENLKESLKQFQKYLVFGLLAALSYFLLVISRSDTTSVNLEGIVSANGVSKEAVSVIWISIFWILGALASYSLERIDRICAKYLDLDSDKIAVAKSFIAKKEDEEHALSEEEEREYSAATEFIAERHLRLEILKAVTTYPSIATEVYPFVRIAPAIISIVVILLARIHIWNPDSRNDIQVIELVFLVIPYIVIALQLLRGSLPIEKPERYRSTLKR